MIFGRLWLVAKIDARLKVFELKKFVFIYVIFTYDFVATQNLQKHYQIDSVS